MDKINSRCKEVTTEYKEKYDRLLSLVNGYEIANDKQSENMKALSEIITNTKELISESDFNELKNEQHNIMKDFYRLEQMKDEPYSDESKEFLDSNNTNTKIQTLNDSNNLVNIKKNFSIDSIQDIKNKKSLLKKISSQSQIQLPKQQQIQLPQQQQIQLQQQQQIQLPQQQIQLPQQQPFIINPNDKNYQVLSNYQGSTPQIPSIQIVNVQEAPKINDCKKNSDLNSTINKFVEKTKVLKPKPKDEKPKIISKIQNPKLKNQVDKIIKVKKKNPDYFNQFIENYTLSMKYPENKSTSKKSKKVKIPSSNSQEFPKKLTPKLLGKVEKVNKKIQSKKCHNSNFIPNIDNSSNNHSLF